jgi:trans-aconitate 2-methyltransferase
MPWNPDKYHQFQKERSAPFEDLLALARVYPGLKAIDLGCGTGELTARLQEALPTSDVIGIDSSPQMLLKAAAFARPGLRFELQSIEAATGEWDLVFSNAAIHWVEDHPNLIGRLFGLARPGGQLVVQMPSNHQHISHRLIIETASEEPFRSALDGWQRVSPVLPVEAYAELLYAAGAAEMTVFEKVYPHDLSGSDAIADWTSGTALVPYFERLGPALKEDFLECYRQKLRAAYPPGPVFYPFKRILFAATRPPG